MKRKEFIHELEQYGCVLHRHGARHDPTFRTTMGSVDN